MPLPWKKTKPNRISRIVADLQPPSRVVETGFPTSVVDLFVKNRDRIKKHSLKKTKHKHFPLHVSESLAPPPTPSLTPHTSPRLPAHESVVISASAASAASATVFDLVEESAPADMELDVIKNTNAKANANAANSNSTVFVVVAKMFLAVIPALSTKKLALWITVSAFLLFLLEILGQFAARFFNCSSIGNWLFSAAAVERRRDGLIDHGGGEEEEEEDEVEFPRRTNFALNNEIQIVESNSDNEQIGFDEALQRESHSNRAKDLRFCSGFELENEEGKSRMEKSQRSRSAKLRAKIIKKLIPKKLRSGKKLKGKKNKKNKIKEEGGVMIMENEQVTDSSCDEEDHEEVWEAHQIWEPEEEEEEEEEIGSSTMGKGEEEEDRRKKNLECKFVILMILVGLCGSRFVALVLTVSGCFMFKFIKFLNLKLKFG